MELKQINEILANLDNPTATKGVSLFKSFSPNGESNEIMKLYSLPVDNIFLKITEEPDSYDSNWKITSVQFVSPQEKVTTVYETIN